MSTPNTSPPSFSWTSSGNYPAGSNLWNSQPLAVAPTPPLYLTPHTKFGAENANYLFGQVASDLKSLYQGEASSRALNWYANAGLPVPGSDTPDAILALGWDPGQKRWLMIEASHTATPTQNLNIFQANDGDLNLGNKAAWSLLSAAGSVTPAKPDALQGSCAIACTTADFYAGYVTASAALVFHNGLATALTAFNSAQSGFTRPSLSIHAALGGAFYLIGTGASAGGTTPNIWCTSPATGFSTGAIVTSQAGVRHWKFADDGASIIVAMPSDLASGSVPATYQTSADGIHWTSRTYPGSGVPFGICRAVDAVGPCFLLGENLAGGAVCKFWRSADGIAWTAQSQPTTPWSSISLSAINSLVMSGGDDSHPPSYSPDGGVTWYPVWSGRLSSNASTGATFYASPKVTNNGLSFAQFNTNSTRFGLATAYAATL